MKIRYAILPVLIIFLFVSGLTLGQSVGNQTSLTNSTLNDSTAAANLSQGSAEHAALNENASTNSSGPNLKYIWAVSGIEKDRIIMVLDQNNTELFGQAKYEPDTGDVWNGLVDGSISGNQVNLVITAQKGKTLESIKLDGTFADDAFSGKFTKNSEGKITARGDFNAMWLSQDISNYTPAKVAETTASQQQAVAAAAPSAQPNNTTSTTNQATVGQTTQSGVKLGGKTKYVDVHEYAEKIGPGGDLSGVPPGMGGTGFGE